MSLPQNIVGRTTQELPSTLPRAPSPHWSPWYPNSRSAATSTQSLGIAAFDPPHTQLRVLNPELIYYLFITHVPIDIIIQRAAQQRATDRSHHFKYLAIPGHPYRIWRMKKEKWITCKAAQILYPGNPETPRDWKRRKKPRVMPKQGARIPCLDIERTVSSHSADNKEGTMAGTMDLVNCLVVVIVRSV